MSKDEEYIQAQIDAAGNTAELAGNGKPQHPPLTQWSQPAELLASLVEEVRALKVVTISANSKKGSKKPEWRPVLRPIGAMAELLKRKRYANHFALRARLLPKKYGKPGQAPAAQPKKEDSQWDSRASFVRRS